MSDDEANSSFAGAEPPAPATPRVSFTEGSITLPAGYEDRSTNLLVPANTATQPNLSIARDWMKPGETLEEYIFRQAGVLQAQLAGHKVLSRQPVHLGAQPAAESDPAPVPGQRIDATYRNGKHTIHMRQAAFEVSPLRVLIFTASSATRFGAAFEQLWSGWLASYQLPLPPPPPSPPPSLPESTNDHA
jgi:hypothetical protein